MISVIYQINIAKILPCESDFMWCKEVGMRGMIAENEVELIEWDVY